MCADIAIHDKGDGNPHCHILLTMRPLNEDKTWGAKSKKEYILDKNGEKVKLKKGNYKTRKINTVDWNEQDKVEEWRKAWADITNKYLEEENIKEKIDHRSYERQGIEQIPTIHMGVSVSQMEKKGIVTDRGNINREIKHQNKILKEIARRIKALLNCSFSNFKVGEIFIVTIRMTYCGNIFNSRERISKYNFRLNKTTNFYYSSVHLLNCF